jgi:hypothetical protein
MVINGCKLCYLLFILQKRNKWIFSECFIECHLSVFFFFFFFNFLHFTDLYQSNFEEERNIFHLIKSITQIQWVDVSVLYISKSWIYFSRKQILQKYRCKFHWTLLNKIWKSEKNDMLYVPYTIFIVFTC